MAKELGCDHEIYSWAAVQRCDDCILLNTDVCPEGRTDEDLMKAVQRERDFDTIREALLSVRAFLGVPYIYVSEMTTLENALEALDRLEEGCEEHADDPN